MGKKSKKELRNIPIDVFLASDRIEDANIGVYNSNGMRIFGANVQLARAIPDIIDGLKPLGRRILYAITKIGKAFAAAAPSLLASAPFSSSSLQF